MSNFTSPEGDLDTLYLHTYEEYLITDTLTTSGQLRTWGYNGYGQIGDNTTAAKSSPVQTVSGGTNWQTLAINTTDSTVGAIKTDGTLWMWGYNGYGGLGNNVNGNGATTTNSRSSPVQTVSGGTNWKEVACGNAQTAAIKTDGSLWTWGSNTYGQLGDNTNGNVSTTTNSKSSPIQTISGGTDWKQVGCGYSTTAAIKTDDTLWLWGANNYGQIGDNTNGNTNSAANSKSSPVQTVSGGTNWTYVACGASHTAATKTDGTLWNWGRNEYGQLGDNSIAHKSSPVQTVAGGTNWKYVACGWFTTTAIKTDGTLWSWGYNNYGQLGDNTNGNTSTTTNSKSSPVQTVAGGTNWKQISGGQYHTAAIKTDGTLWSWGYNAFGGLANNSITHRSSPVQTVAGGTVWRQVVCHIAGSLATTI